MWREPGDATRSDEVTERVLFMEEEGPFIVKCVTDTLGALIMPP